MKEIEITIDRQGGCTVEGHGFKGPECEAATRAIEEALGERSSVKHKPEFRQQAVQQQNLRR